MQSGRTESTGNLPSIEGLPRKPSDEPREDLTQLIKRTNVVTDTKKSEVQGNIKSTQLKKLNFLFTSIAEPAIKSFIPLRKSKSSTQKPSLEFAHTQYLLYSDKLKTIYEGEWKKIKSAENCEKEILRISTDIKLSKEEENDTKLRCLKGYLTSLKFLESLNALDFVQTQQQTYARREAKKLRNEGNFAQWTEETVEEVKKNYEEIKTAGEPQLKHIREQIAHHPQKIEYDKLAREKLDVINKKDQLAVQRSLLKGEKRDQTDTEWNDLVNREHTLIPQVIKLWRESGLANLDEQSRSLSKKISEAQKKFETAIERSSLIEKAEKQLNNGDFLAATTTLSEIEKNSESNLKELSTLIKNDLQQFVATNATWQANSSDQDAQFFGLKGTAGKKTPSVQVSSCADRLNNVCVDTALEVTKIEKFHSINSQNLPLRERIYELLIHAKETEKSKLQTLLARLNNFETEMQIRHLLSKDDFDGALDLFTYSDFKPIHFQDDLGPIQALAHYMFSSLSNEVSGNMQQTSGLNDTENYIGSIGAFILGNELLSGPKGRIGVCSELKKLHQLIKNKELKQLELELEKKNPPFLEPLISFVYSTSDNVKQFQEALKKCIQRWIGWDTPLKSEDWQRCAVFQSTYIKELSMRKFGQNQESALSTSSVLEEGAEVVLKMLKMFSENTNLLVSIKSVDPQDKEEKRINEMETAFKKFKTRIEEGKKFDPFLSIISRSRLDQEKKLWAAKKTQGKDRHERTEAEENIKLLEKVENEYIFNMDDNDLKTAGLLAVQACTLFYPKQVRFSKLSTQLDKAGIKLRK